MGLKIPVRKKIMNLYIKLVMILNIPFKGMLNMRRSIRWCLLALAFIFPHKILLAGNDNPFLLPMGEQEALFNNAGIGLSGSPANVLFNPAGISDINSSRLTVSGSTYTLIKAQFENEGTTDDLTFTSFNAVPNMIAGSKAFKKWTVAYGLFSPNAIEIDADYKTTISSIPAQAHVLLYSKSEEQYAGFASSRKIGHDWSIGVSLLGHRYHENNMTSNFITPSGAAPYISVVEKIEVEVVSILAILGVQKKVSDDFRLGLRLNLPAVPVFDVSQVYEEKQIYNGATLTKEIIDEKSDGAEYSLPLDVGLGAVWTISARHTLLSDVSLQTGAKYDTLPGSTKNYRIELGPTVRGNIGYKYRLNDHSSLLAGVNWNPSTIRDGTRASDGEQKLPLHFLSVSGGVYFVDDNVNTGVGVFYGASRTDRQFFGNEPENNTSLNAIGMILSASISY